MWAHVVDFFTMVLVFQKSCEHLWLGDRLRQDRRQIVSQIQQSNLRLSERLDSLERRTRQEVSGDQYQHHDHVIMQTTETYNLQLMMMKFYLSFILECF